MATLPIPNPPDLQNLQQIKTNLLLQLQYETALATAINPATGLINGLKPTYSLDGENYDWTGWRVAVLNKIDMLNRLIQLESGPYEKSMQYQV